MENYAIEINSLTKKYKLYNKPIERLKESLNPLGKKYHRDFYALKNLSFNVKKGETIGIIGKNGSGKSTLLKIITGVLDAYDGSVRVDGKISALLELGAGFNPEYTGIENIYINGTVIGYSKKEMDEKLEEILEFADIGDFINQPVKYYSSGMFVRLAFAVAINVDPDILIVDEALSVGDIRFQQKCFRKIEEFKKSKTVLFVSHDMASINKYCERVIWLNDGEIIEEGIPLEISKKYRSFMMDSELSNYAEQEYQELGEAKHSDLDIEKNIALLTSGLEMSGDRKAQITGAGLFDSKSNVRISIASPGQNVKLYIKAKLKNPIKDIIIGFTIKDRLGNIVAQSNSYALGETIDIFVKEKDSIISSFEFIIPNLNNGIYTISPAIASGTQEEHVQHCWLHDAVIFEVINRKSYLLEGYLFLDPIKFRIIE